MKNKKLVLTALVLIVITAVLATTLVFKLKAIKEESPAETTKVVEVESETTDASDNLDETTVAETTTVETTEETTDADEYAALIKEADEIYATGVVGDAKTKEQFEKEWVHYRSMMDYSKAYELEFGTKTSVDYGGSVNITLESVE